MSAPADVRERIPEGKRERRMVRERLKPREGPSIREFLRYYVLVLLQERPMSARNLRRTVKRQSGQNRDFRPSGVLLVGTRDLRLVLRQLKRRDLVEQSEGKWQLTSRGRNRLSAYEKQKDAKGNGKERAARRLLSLMAGQDTARTVLDVGTGEGFLAFKLADEGHRVLGIDSGGFDYSRDSIRSALEKAEARGGQVEFRQSSVTELAGTDERFDYVVTSQAVHCMKDQNRCLEAICRLLRPGGTFLCMDFLVGLEGFFHHGWHSFLAISREEWRQLLPRCGFQEVSCRKAGDYLIVRARKPLGAAE
jgi:ubiquinone/menaquinone biosynthesis C-methylase UbiE